MASYIIGFVNQKGGCGKSTLSRLFAQQLASEGVSVLIADMDVQQESSSEWSVKRQKTGLERIDALAFTSVQDAHDAAENYSALIFDGQPHASKQTLEIAKTSDLIVIPTGVGNDDLNPSIILAHELKDTGIPLHCIRFALFRTDSGSDKETADARSYIEAAGYQVLDGALPDKPSYRRALDAGRAPSETFNPVTGKPYATLNGTAIRLSNSIAGALQTAVMKSQQN